MIKLYLNIKTLRLNRPVPKNARTYHTQTRQRISQLDPIKKVVSKRNKLIPKIKNVMQRLTINMTVKPITTNHAYIRILLSYPESSQERIQLDKCSLHQ